MTKLAKKNCVIIGAGAYGQVYTRYLAEEYTIMGFFDSDPNLFSQKINGYPILGEVNEIHSYISQHPQTSIFVPLGDNKRRVELLSDFDKRGYEIPSFIHESVFLESDITIGKAVYILPRTNIMPFTIIQDYVMISMGVNIAHHVNIHEGCFFSQGCNIGASMQIYKKAYCGIASTVMTGVKSLGAGCLIGAGCVVIRDVPDRAVIVGNPGKQIKILK